MRRAAPRRPGLSALEVVLTTGVMVPIAAFLYWMLERVIDHYFFLLGNAVGWPFF